VDWFRRRYGECEIVGGDNILFSICLCFGILRVPILFVRSCDFVIEQYTAGKGMVGCCMGRHWFCLGDEGEYSIYCAVHSEREEVLGCVSGLLLLHFAWMVGAFILSGVVVEHCMKEEFKRLELGCV